MADDMRASIVGTGHYLPGPPICNEELIERHQLKIRSYFVRNNVGAETRHFASPGQATSDLATEAAARAVEASGLPRSAIRRILLATVSGDYPTPATACIVQRNLGMKGTAAIDIVGACSGFLQAIDLGARCVVTGEGPVLVIGADIRSRQLDFTDLRTVFLYGDGAGAVVLAASHGEEGIWHSLVTADGLGAEAVYIPAGGSREPVTCDSLQHHRHQITMKDGALVAGHARSGFREVVGRLSAESGVAVADIGYFCLHQPNLLLVRQVLADLGIPAERAWINFPRYANTTSATVPIALSEAAAAGKLVPGEWLCLAAVGAGFAAAAQLIRWGPP